MMGQRFKWIKPKPLPSDIDQELNSFPPVLRQILYHRNIFTQQDAINYLLPKEEKWQSSLQLRDTEKSVQLIQDAINNDHTIAIFGDYDVDGITSTALLYLALSTISSKITTYIPNRFEEGYGLNQGAIDLLKQQDTKLIITVDNGIRSWKETQYANSQGIKVIITDHHAPEGELPPAAAIMNPKTPDDPYPFKHLAGVGVAYKLVNALSSTYPSINPKDYLDLVAIGTVSDIVPLLGENRYLVRTGIAKLNQFRRQGIISLLGAANILFNQIHSTDISFQIGPRLNASGRLGSADIALRLLLSTDPHECGVLAQQLENINKKRKRISRDITYNVEHQLKMMDPKPLILFALDPDFHSGVTGIAAGAITRQYHIPSIVGQIKDDHATASCRSIPEFNMIWALDQCQDLFIKYGGHKLAAGFSIENQKIPDLKDRMSNLAAQQLSDIDLIPTLEIDAEVSLDQLDATLYQMLQKMEPTGSKNPETVFLCKGLQLSNPKTVGHKNDHLKMTVTDGSHYMDSIGFGLGNQLKELPRKIDVLFNFHLNEYRGNSVFQINLLDYKPSED